MSPTADTVQATPRTRVQRVLDSVLTRLWRLPAQTSSYTVTRDLRVPMRDGAVLLADLYTPTGPVKGTVLVRSPYGWAAPMAGLSGTVYASRGYQVVLARCRGTFGSGGAFEPFIHEVDDGADTVAWMREQPWFTGSFATLGGSYFGFTQWALLMDPPPEMKAATIFIAPHDFHAAIYRGGAFNLLDYLSWAHLIAHQEEQSVLTMLKPPKRLSHQDAAQLPIADAGERYLDGRLPWYRDWVTRREPDDPMWQAMDCTKAVEQARIPVLLMAGWQDAFLGQMLADYRCLEANGADVGLTVGPWTHGQFMFNPKAGRTLTLETLDWLDTHLAGKPSTRPRAVHVHFSGPGSQWRDLRTWPPTSKPTTLHLGPDGVLGDTPAADQSVCHFRYDPSNPTTTVGGTLLQSEGHCDDGALAARHDVLTFTGAPLAGPLEVAGAPTVQLDHRTDNPYADIFLRICEVDPRGRSRNVSDGFVRLDPAAASGTVSVEMDSIAHVFAARNRIRLVIAGGNFPRFERNPGTAENPGTATVLVPSRRTIRLASSTLTLPVVAAEV